MKEGCLRSPNVVLRAHQLAVVRRLMRQRGAIAVHSTGAGKSLTAIASANCLLLNHLVEWVVVLVKKSAITQFEQQVHRYNPNLPLDRFLFTTHQTFFNKHVHKFKPGRVFLVVDEAHEFTNPDAKVTRQLYNYSLKVPHVLLLTATPVVNLLYDFAPLLAIARGVPIPTEKEFEQILASPKLMREWFGSVVNMHLIDKSKDPNYPKTRYNNVLIRMSAATDREYKRQEKHPQPFLINLRRLSLGFGNECEKCKWLVQNVKKWIAKGEGKIVVYTAYIETGAEKLRRLLLSEGINTLVIQGNTTVKARRQAALLFNKTKQQEAEQFKQENLRELVEDEEIKGTRCGVGNVLALRQSHLIKPAGPKKKYGFTYSGPGGGRLDQATREYAEGLVVPPAWTPAEICKTNNKLLWAAQDNKGRWQRRYSENWEVQQEYVKILNLKDLDRKFWQRFNNIVERDMHTSTWTKKRYLGVAAKMLQVCKIRVGSRSDDGEEPEELDSKHYGLMTLRKRHIKLLRRVVHVEFVGKSGKVNRCDIDRQSALGRSLSEMVALTSKPGDRVFPTTNAADVRQYLASIKANLRPKNFRTYYANYTLINMLRSHPLPLDQTPRQRSKRLAEVYRTASTGLNNTPTVARDSYVFSGLWVLYLADPRRFQNILVQNASRPTYDLLDRFIRLFDENVIDWRMLLRAFKETKGVANFLGPANVLLISDAGSESVDLAGARHIVFMDNPWTPSLEDQIIGRGQRYKSHENLPVKERTLTVWKLFLTRANGKPAVDHHVAELLKKKQTEQSKLYKRIAQL